MSSDEPSTGQPLAPIFCSTVWFLYLIPITLPSLSQMSSDEPSTGQPLAPIFCSTVWFLYLIPITLPSLSQIKVHCLSSGYPSGPNFQLKSSSSSSVFGVTKSKLGNTLSGTFSTIFCVYVI
ncbi:Hypothetical_protein [Hexamita inflata]|uniref:Hypothetical_protein n=1 Tax=Hexamita inflata TaxID=28002 RepID=A0AA86UUZ4_9EUKA|nr:Hypothetical protein HINF_LOCUS56549 [Hexamita inflata]